MRMSNADAGEVKMKQSQVSVRRCTMCGLDKRSDDFYERGGKRYSGKFCKPCSRNRYRAGRIKYKRKLAIGVTELTRILVAATCCAVCGVSPEVCRHLCVDHCHKTGVIRGAPIVT